MPTVDDAPQNRRESAASQQSAGYCGEANESHLIPPVASDGRLSEVGQGTPMGVGN